MASTKVFHLIFRHGTGSIRPALCQLRTAIQATASHQRFSFTVCLTGLGGQVEFYRFLLLDVRFFSRQKELKDKIPRFIQIGHLYFLDNVFLSREACQALVDATPNFLSW